MLADSDRLLAAERECCRCIEALEALSGQMALAKQIVGLRDDRIKKELAVLVAEYLKGGDSAAASEWNARADKRFAAACSHLIKETAASQDILNAWELQKLKFENAQALRNDERAKMKML